MKRSKKKKRGRPLSLEKLVPLTGYVTPEDRAEVLVRVQDIRSKSGHTSIGHWVATAIRFQLNIRKEPEAET